MDRRRARGIVWKCPKCSATSGKHGKGGPAACKDVDSGSVLCNGFICECDPIDDAASEDASHGLTHTNPCPNAVCYHCGWAGTFPMPLFDPKKLTGWAKQAYAAGWRPPEGWTPNKAASKRGKSDR